MGLYCPGSETAGSLARILLIPECILALLILHWLL